jgi:hypothetical protein
MRRRALVVVLALSAAASAVAQPRRLPASAPQPTPCVQVRIGNDEAGRWSCLNQAMQAEVAKAAPVANTAHPGDALAPIGKGLATPAATRQRLGNQYGKSIVPQRPPQHFPSPALGPVR